MNPDGFHKEEIFRREESILENFSLGQLNEKK